MSLKDLININIETINKNTVIIYAAGYRLLKSYDTTIAVIQPDGSVLLGPEWAVSATTSKQRSLFLGEPTKVTRDKLVAGEYTLLVGADYG